MVVQTSDPEAGVRHVWTIEGNVERIRGTPDPSFGCVRTASSANKSVTCARGARWVSYTIAYELNEYLIRRFVYARIRDNNNNKEREREKERDSTEIGGTHASSESAALSDLEIACRVTAALSWFSRVQRCDRRQTCVDVRRRRFLARSSDGKRGSASASRANRVCIVRRTSWQRRSHARTSSSLGSCSRIAPIVRVPLS